MKQRFWILAILILLLVLPAVSMVSAQETNLIDGCVEQYDPDVDYFPEKVTVEYATGLQVAYFNNYKIVTVLTPWPGATPDDAFQYVLVQCGTPAPEGYDDAYMIEIPAGDIITLSTTHLPHLAELGLLDHLIGLDSFLWTSTPGVIDKINAGELIEVGGGGGSPINVEMVLDADPDIVMVNATGAAEYDDHPALLDAGVFVAMNAEHVEPTPLGRAEWIKFTALFYNVENRANAFFDDVAAQYNTIKEQAAAVADEDKPLVLWNSYTSYGDAWYIPGGDTFIGQLLRDANANVVLWDDPSVMEAQYALPFDFEVVYDAGAEADVWFPGAFMWYSLPDVKAADERYVDFAPFKNGAIYNNNARENANGGNDYYEGGVLNPHLVLADLVSILYPDVLPDYELVYFRKLAPADE